jgi:tRNA U34 5-carboxymethylaminomethyl modifying enzyme MnmG/GidA
VDTRRYSVIVIGGGHAGVEAAWAAANLLPSDPPVAGRCRPTIALVTLDPSKIGVMSCNPAIGGLAKGQIVREIDALGGLMGLAADATGIMFKVLNTSRGAAVRGPRAQCDKHAYAEAVQRLIASRPEIEVIAGSVEELVVKGGRITGVVVGRARPWTADNAADQPRRCAGPDCPPAADLGSLRLAAPAVVLTTGTFMRGLMHTGESMTPGGRHGEGSAVGISDALRRLGFELGRLKTGTPPRLQRDTIDWDALEPQQGDDAPTPFSDLSASPVPRLGRSGPSRETGDVPRLGGPRPSRATGNVPRLGRSGPSRATGDVPRLGGPRPSRATGNVPRLGGPGPSRATGNVPRLGRSGPSRVLGGTRTACPERQAEARGSPLDLVAPSLRLFPTLPQVDCRITSTTPAIHDAIRANLHRAPMYSGQIESVGPRYCPSIEDKVVRFGDRTSHHVFLEPESLRDDWVYCNGISTSLPADVQETIVRGMPGCERARIYRYGYAVEYDMVRPHQVAATCMTKSIDGLFLAGQINGTSGYEEAAAQGIVAGINAARFALGRPPVTIGRDRAYIGVLMDDLVTKTPVEPYRMFTSRAEHRLLLRADNAADRLTPLAIELGLLDSTDLGRRRRDLFAQRRADLADLDRRIDAARVEGLPLADLLRRHDFTPDDLAAALGVPPSARPRLAAALFTVHTDRFYAAYIARQDAEVRRQAELERRRIPPTLDYAAIPSLRAEARHALARFRPETLGQAGRLEGITPADLTLLAVVIGRQHAPSRPQRVASVP